MPSLLENPEEKSVNCLAIFQVDPAQDMARQDELDIATAPSPSSAIASNLDHPRRVNGKLARPLPRLQHVMLAQSMHQEE